MRTLKSYVGARIKFTVDLDQLRRSNGGISGMLDLHACFTGIAKRGNEYETLRAKNGIISRPLINEGAYITQGGA